MTDFDIVERFAKHFGLKELALTTTPHALERMAPL